MVKGKGAKPMPAPDFQWVANPDIITSAIKLLAGAVVALGGMLIAGGKWVAGYMMKSMNDRSTSIEAKLTLAVTDLSGKLDRLATGMEHLALTTSNQITKIEVRCEERHSNHSRRDD